MPGKSSESLRKAGERPLPEVSPAGLRSKLRQFPIRQVEPGQRLYEQGEEARSCFYVLSGQLTISSAMEDGTEFHLDSAGSGDLLGLEALCRDHYQDAARCVRKARIIVIPRARLIPLLSADANLALSFLAAAINALCLSRERLLNVCGRTAMQRLARLLLGSGDGESGDGQGLRLEWGTRSRMAKHLAITQETFSRLVRRLKAQGIIRSNRSEIVVVDRHRLRQLAGRRVP